MLKMFNLWFYGKDRLAKMMLILRLKRKFLAYKCSTVLILIILFILFVRILQVNFSDSYDNTCPNHEPIDVVYTWVNGSDPRFQNELNNYLRKHNLTMRFMNQRFDDKYELKFSLRSIEKFIPWIRHVYIVTNGQIPYWLNLDYEKVSVITHKDIFTDVTNLPTFSSPAIESNLHRIPGLSKRFIYFNDDIFLNEPISFDDFYHPNRGYILYFSWPIPQCAPSCAWMYVADGQCDRECFLPECQMDGGDCEGLEAQIHLKTTTTAEAFAKGENETRRFFLADAINKIRVNLLNTFMKKLSPPQKSDDLIIPVLNHSRIFRDEMKNNISSFVDWHNKYFLRNDRLRRKMNRKKNINDRNLVDVYSASLQHTNRILNLKYGFKLRKVPSHTPIFIDSDIVIGMRRKFYDEMIVTERNRIRQKNDFQFSLGYYYYLISEVVQKTTEEIFDKFDTDSSGTWSDREIRTLLTKMYRLPLTYAIVDHFESILINCSEHVTLLEVSTPPFERYIDSKLPTITKELVLKCPPLLEQLRISLGNHSKYNYEIIPNSENKYVHFKMLNSNISDVVNDLDDVRSSAKKFVCLNDNLDESKDNENELVKAILYDFYLSLFPHPSKFELPEDIRNKFEYMSDLQDWKEYRQKVKLFIYLLIFATSFFAIYSFCRRKCCKISNKRLFC